MVNPYRYAFATNISAIATSGSTVDLGLGEIGIFDAKTYQATNGATSSAIIIAQGNASSPVSKGYLTGNFTPSTTKIEGRRVKSWKKVPARKASGMVAYMGYAGIDKNKNLSVPLTESFTFWMTLSGTPIALLLSNSPETHDPELTLQFTVQLPCPTGCATDVCGETHDHNLVADAVIKEFSTRKIIGGQLLSDYVKLTKLVSCTTPSGLPTVSYTKYKLVVADNGSSADLGKVQAQYPGKTITRTKRDGIFSTYEFSQLTGDSAPASFNNSVTPVIPNCTTCPSGYTLVPSVDTYIVERPIQSTTDLHTPSAQATFAAAVSAAYSGVATPIFLSFNGSTANVQIFVSTGTVPTNVAADTILFSGASVPICTQNVATTVAWTTNGTCTGATKDYVLTLKNNDCGGNYLTALQALYPTNNVVVIDTDSATCTTQYGMTVSSENKDCDACDEVLYTFKEPMPFMGIKWTEVIGQTGYGSGCNVGIQAESIYEARQTKECFFDQVSRQYEPLFISFSTRNPDPNNTSLICATDVPVGITKNVTYPRGFGWDIANKVMHTMYEFNKGWHRSAVERDALGIELGVDLTGYYDEYVLTYEDIPTEAHAISGFGVSQVQTFEITVAFPSGGGAAFENAINAFVTRNTDLSLEVFPV